MSLPGNRTRSSTGRNQAVSGPAALVGIRNGGREGIRTPGLLIANSRENKLRQGAPQSLSYFNGALNWQTWQTRLFPFFFILPALWVAEFLLCRFQNAQGRRELTGANPAF